jgi:hypothetical protein
MEDLLATVNGRQDSAAQYNSGLALEKRTGCAAARSKS